MYKQVAVLIDGGFFIQRVNYYLRKFFDNYNISAIQLTDLIWHIVKYHIEAPHGKHTNRSHLELYRIYFYDCSPTDKQVKLPFPEDDQKTPKNINFKIHPPYVLRKELHTELLKNRKTALRLGVLADHGGWQLNTFTLDKLIKKEVEWKDITNDDFHYDIKQKAVDIKLGMDITTLACEKLVSSIILIAGDSDFVPAAKLAHTKGIDFILDPMQQTITNNLSAHIDGIQSCNMIKALYYICKKEPTNKPDWWDEYIKRKNKPRASKISTIQKKSIIEKNNDFSPHRKNTKPCTCRAFLFPLDTLLFIGKYMSTTLNHVVSFDRLNIQTVQ